MVGEEGAGPPPHSEGALGLRAWDRKGLGGRKRLAMSCVGILAVGLEAWKPAGGTDLPGDHTLLQPQGRGVTEPQLGLGVWFL